MSVDDAAVTQFRNCEVLREGGLVPGDVWVREGRIIDPQALFYDEKKVPNRVIDCRGMLVAPGFIDIQINGAFGIDFSSLEGSVSEGVGRVAHQLLRHGVTSFCPTIVTTHPDYYHKVLPEMRCVKGSKEGAAVLGVHCEGPFISREKRGAHREDSILDSLSPSALQQCYGSLDNIRIITLAPELPGAREAIRWLSKERGMVVSLGHSMASLETAEEAVKDGASLVTHLFNAMLPFHHRDPGIVGLLTSLALNGKQLYYGLIADGYHTHETVLRIAYKANPSGVVLVTDAIAAMGLGEGAHSLGSMRVEVKNGAARLAGKNTLAGSVASMDQCVRHFKNATGCTVAEALQVASLHPARALGLAEKGTLDCRAQAEADLVILDRDLRVQATYIAGEEVWRAPGCRISSWEDSAGSPWD